MNSFKWVLRFVVVVIIFSLVGFGIYLGFPYLYQQWIKPLEEQGLQLKELKTQFNNNQESFSTRLTDLQDRIQALTLQQDKNKEVISNLAQNIEEISRLKNTQEALAKQAENLNIEIEKYASNSEALNKQFGIINTHLQEQQTMLATLSVQNQQQATAISKREQETILIRILEYISHSRSAFASKNYGSAQEDLQAARDLLNQGIRQQTFSQSSSLAAIDQRLELVINELNTNPLLAEEDHDILWLMVMNALSNTDREDSVPFVITPSPLVGTTTSTPPSRTPTFTPPVETPMPTPIPTERL
jgi:hypothetical protein